MDNCIAVIPARGGSKRIPKKNIRPFLGKPIISYAIEAAVKSGLFEEIMVSTDSAEIAETAKEYGAGVPFMRDCAMADDYVSSDDVLLDVLREYKSRGRQFRYMTCIYPTSVFVTPEKLHEAMELLKAHGDAAMVMPVTAFSYPPQRCCVIDKNGMAVWKYPEYISARSQDLEKLYHDAGQYYVYDTEKFIQAQGKIFDHMIPVVMDELSVQDIDNESDWKMAELKYKAIHMERETL